MAIKRQDRQYNPFHSVIDGLSAHFKTQLVCTTLLVLHPDRETKPQKRSLEGVTNIWFKLSPASLPPSLDSRLPAFRSSLHPGYEKSAPSASKGGSI